MQKRPHLDMIFAAFGALFAPKLRYGVFREILLLAKREEALQRCALFDYRKIQYPTTLIHMTKKGYKFEQKDIMRYLFKHCRSIS